MVLPLRPQCGSSVARLFDVSGSDLYFPQLYLAVYIAFCCRWNDTGVNLRCSYECFASKFTRSNPIKTSISGDMGDMAFREVNINEFIRMDPETIGLAQNDTLFLCLFPSLHMHSRKGPLSL